MVKSRKKTKVSHATYFSDSEEDVPSAKAPLLEAVESYSKLNGMVNQSSTVIETVRSPKKQTATLLTESAIHRSSGAKRARADSENGADGGELDGLSFLEDTPSPTLQPTPTGEKPKRKTRASPLLDFMPIIDTLLDEMLRLEGLGDAFAHATCKDCHADIAMPGSSAYRCLDCDPTALWCKSCCVSAHSHSYLHRIQVWTGGCFEKTSLRDLGLRIQLGHTAGVVCPYRGDDPGVEFVIIDSDAIHVVTIDYCRCHRGVDRMQQLLRAKLLPATVLNPRTAATFRVLETFQMLSFSGKISAYEFLMAIQRRTDNTTTFSVKQRNREWMRMIHLFRHLRMMKRGGRGHAAEGAGGTKEGELAVLCPACPLSGVNMPKDWHLLPEDQMWIHALFLAIDANFRLKRKCNSSNENDPGLSHGFAYIVAEFLFKSFLRENEKKLVEEKSTCSNHDAIRSAQIRGGKGEKAASGLGACQCARHDMKRPCGAGDLQKGERYINMDYFILSTLRFALLSILVISYDIACQWSRNLRARCAAYPANPISQSPKLKTIFCVPKFHAPAHVLSCRVNFSFNLTPGVGRTDGEAPERGWSAADNLATSTREMGPGNRRDTFDDFFGQKNWDKSVWMSEDLAGKGRTAMTMCNRQGNAFKIFAGSIPVEARVAFTKQVQDWEKDKSLPNPHENPEIKIDVKQTRLRLSREDEDAIKAKLVLRVHTDMTGSLFVLEGIEIEETQRRVYLESEALGDHSTDLDRSKVQEHKNSLLRKLQEFMELRRLFLPSAVFGDEAPTTPTENGVSGEPVERMMTNGSLETEPDDDNDEEEPWEVELHLPSDLLAHSRKCERTYVRYKFLFRISQAHTTLKELRAQLLQQDHMVLSKKKYTRGTAMLTMSNSLLRDIGARIKEEKRRYRDVYRRLHLLWTDLSSKEAGPLDDLKDQLKWMEVLKELKSGDAKGLTSQDGNKLGEGMKGLPWIWTVGADAKETANISLRVEFCRTRARAHRWQEECLLLAEEMRRVERFWAWDAKRWQARATAQKSVAEGRVQLQGEKDKQEGVTREPPTEFQARDSQSIIHGKVAYAIRQVRVRTRLLEEAKRQHGTLPALLESGPPLIECARTVPNMLSTPLVPQKPMRPGGRAHRSRAEANPQPGRHKKAEDAEERGSDEGEADADDPGGIEPANVVDEGDQEDPGKTYDGTDEE